MATCSTCHQNPGQVFACKNCGQVRYCNRDCQKKDWVQHKKSCFSPQQQKDQLLAQFNLTQKDLMTRILYQEMTTRIRPANSPLPAMVNFLVIFMIGDATNTIREQFIKVYEIAIDIFQKSVTNDMVRQKRQHLIKTPEKIPLVTLEYYQERSITVQKSKFLHGLSLTLYPFEDQPLEQTLGADSIIPLKNVLQQARLEQGKDKDPVGFVLPLEQTSRTAKYLPILDFLKRDSL